MILAAHQALAAFNGVPRPEAERTLLECCASARWATAVASGRPYPSPDALYRTADEALEALDDAEFEAALAGHPRIGERTQSASSRREQSGVAGSDATTLAALVAANREYEARFGHVYLVSAEGRSAAELLSVLRERLHNDPATERAVARGELRKINRLRLSRLVGEAE